MSLSSSVIPLTRFADSVVSPEPFSSSSPVVPFLLGVAIIVVVIVVVRRLLRARVEHQRERERELRPPPEPPETP